MFIFCFRFLRSQSRQNNNFDFCAKRLISWNGPWFRRANDFSGLESFSTLIAALIVI